MNPKTNVVSLVKAESLQALQTMVTEPCPITTVLEILAAKWSVEILRETAIGPTRTSGFLKRIPQLSMKSLQCRLKELENFGLIERCQYDERQVRVEHRITPRGLKAIAIYNQIKSLAEEMIPHNCQCPMESCQGETAAPVNCPRRSGP